MKYLLAAKLWLATRFSGPAVRVTEVDAPPARARDLFFQHFRQQIPETPRHFILEACPGWFRGPMVLGYVHFEPFKDAYLAGGLVVDAWRFRKLPTDMRARIHDRGGLAEWLMTESCDLMSSSLAIYAYIGDKRSKKVLMRVGFGRVPDHEYLYVLPRQGADRGDALAERTRSVAGIGPF